jgi:hypothetical protein
MNARLVRGSWMRGTRPPPGKFDRKVGVDQDPHGEPAGPVEVRAPSVGTKAGHLPIIPGTRNFAPGPLLAQRHFRR